MSATSEPGKTHYRTIFLSDVHLGTRGCQAERLIDFLKHHTCDRLYLVGDIIDGWRMKSTMYWPQSHSNVVRRLLTLAKRETEIVYVTGNHDEFLRRYSDHAFGNIRLVDRAVHLTPDGRRYLVVHGDEYDVITRYHRWIAFLGDLGYTMLLEVNRLNNWVRERLGFGRWSLSAWVKHRVKRAVNFIGEFETAIAQDCEREGFDGVVCGHIHHAEIRRIGAIEYLNCGDWVESCTALVEDEDGEIRILDWLPETPRGQVVPLRAPAANDRAA
jgi:UDP-2,3-diacylglucosamine pyrophosphatase LpxH